MRTSLLHRRSQLPNLSKIISPLTYTTTSRLHTPISLSTATTKRTLTLTTKSNNKPLKMSTGIPNQTPDQQANLARRKSSTSASTTTAGLTASAAVASNDLGIESSDFIVAPGVELNDKQRVLVGSVLDVSLVFVFDMNNVSLLRFPPFPKLFLLIDSFYFCYSILQPIRSELTSLVTTFRSQPRRNPILFFFNYLILKSIILLLLIYKHSYSQANQP